MLPLVGWIGRRFGIGFQLPKLIFGRSLIILSMPLGMNKPEKLGIFWWTISTTWTLKTDFKDWFLTFYSDPASACCVAYLQIYGNSP